MCADALIGLLRDGVRTETGEILFEGNNLRELDDAGWRDLRGRRIAMVFQEPMTALNPLMRSGDQIMEMFEAHDLFKTYGLLTQNQRRQRALGLTPEAGLRDPPPIPPPSPHPPSPRHTPLPQLPPP